MSERVSHTGTQSGQLPQNSSSLIFTLTSGNLFYSRKKGDLHKQSNKKVDYYLLCESENTRSIL